MTESPALRPHPNLVDPTPEPESIYPLSIKP
jgi:hypothetical protein